MSRKSEKVEGETVRGENGRNMEQNLVGGGEKRHDKIQLHQSRGEDGTHQNDEEERKQLLLVEDAPIQLQMISAACQSPLFEGKVGKKKGLSQEEENGDGDDDVFHHNPYYHPDYYEKNGRWTTVPYAFLTLILALLNLIWSVGLSYWNFQLDNFDIAVASLVIVILSGSITTIAFFSTNVLPSKNARRNLWKCSKVAWLFTAIPTLVPVVLGIVYFISSVLDNGSPLTNDSSNSDNSQGRNERRQCAKSNGTISSTLSSPTSPPQQLPLIFLVEKWRACSVSFFLIESIGLCFPMCVLHLCVLLENPNTIPSFIGFYTLLGLFLFTFSITFSRFQYDSTHKRDRFGEGTEKYLRFCYLWSAKIIWLVTFAILIVSARVRYPEWRIEATVCASLGLAAIHEIPLWICLIPQCGWLAAKMSSLFFIIPQFTSLISLIFWVNTDATVYHTDIGSIVLGVYFWSEAVLLCGWLADGNAEKDIDLVPLYPHFLGDFISTCFVDRRAALPY